MIGFGIAVIAWNVIATTVAVIANWPSQFGRVGTDAKSEFISVGSAISAPALPLAVLVVSLLMIRAGSKWSLAGLIGYSIVALLFIAGGIGELFALPTPDTSRSVLIAGGISAGTIAIVMLVLAFGAFKTLASDPPGARAPRGR